MLRIKKSFFITVPGILFKFNNPNLHTEKYLKLFDLLNINKTIINYIIRYLIACWKFDKDVQKSPFSKGGGGEAEGDSFCNTKFFNSNVHLFLKIFFNQMKII